MARVKVVILAGGQGTRLVEETEVRPKPMVEIGDRPILWHIMKHFARHGFTEFVIALGYKGDHIKRFFAELLTLDGNVTVRLDGGVIERHEPERDPWTVHLVETGPDTGTGGRLARLREWVDDGPFFLTYGDGVSDIDLEALTRFHASAGATATVTAVRPPSRFGELVFSDGNQVRFTEKSQTGEGWINGGFMILDPEVLPLIEGEDSSLEYDVLETLSNQGKVAGFQHTGFWQSMDTMRDVRYLRALWAEGTAPWSTW
jgi:glucose-1-phosphate cytidylyltransferase